MKVELQNVVKVGNVSVEGATHAEVIDLLSKIGISGPFSVGETVPAQPSTHLVTSKPVKDAKAPESKPAAAATAETKPAAETKPGKKGRAQGDLPLQEKGAGKKQPAAQAKVEEVDDDDAADTDTVDDDADDDGDADDADAGDSDELVEEIKGMAKVKDIVEHIVKEHGQTDPDEVWKLLAPVKDKVPALARAANLEVRVKSLAQSLAG